MGVKRKFNRGDALEGYVGAAMTAKFLKRGRDGLGTITKQDVQKVLKNFQGNPHPAEASVYSAAAIPDMAHSRVSVKNPDKITFKLKLPKAAWNLLTTEKNGIDICSDLYQSAINYVEKSWTSDLVQFYTNGKHDHVEIISDGVSDQTGTKVDIAVMRNGTRYKRQISLKTANTKQFAQISGHEFDKQLKIWDKFALTNMNEIEKEYNTTIQEGLKEFSGQFFSSRQDIQLASYVKVFKNASRAVYKKAATQLNGKASSDDFLDNFIKLVAWGIQGDNDKHPIELTVLGPAKHKSISIAGDELREWKKALKNANITIDMPDRGDPKIRFYIGPRVGGELSRHHTKLVCQIRVKVEKIKSAGGYVPYMRNYFEYGTGLFTLVGKILG